MFILNAALEKYEAEVLERHAQHVRGETRDARRAGLTLSRLAPPVASFPLTAKIKRDARCLEHICIVV